jgi:hypothetical protein
MNIEELRQWQVIAETISEVRVTFPDAGLNAAPAEVQIVLRTGKVLTANWFSSSSDVFAVPVDYAASVILATAVLTRLLSLWMETRPQTIAVLARTSAPFLQTSSKISAMWDDLWTDMMDYLQAPKKRMKPKE